MTLWINLQWHFYGALHPTGWSKNCVNGISLLWGRLDVYFKLRNKISLFSSEDIVRQDLVATPDTRDLPKNIVEERNPFLGGIRNSHLSHFLGGFRNSHLS